VAGFFEPDSPHHLGADAAIGENLQQRRLKMAMRDVGGGIDVRTPTVHSPHEMHHLREIQSLQMHRRIAAMMERDPDAVIGKALRNLHAWAAHPHGSAMEPVFKEWLDLLARMEPSEIAAFIVSDSERAVRLRQSTPFAGVLSPREVWAIKRGHEAA
jgi:hypothetical protein